LDDGRLTDSQGRTVSFRNTVIIMTSNIGSQWLLDLGQERWEEAIARVMEALRQTFKPEFLNRVDDIIVFRPLGRGDLEKIVDLQVERVRALLRDRGLSLELTPAAKEFLVERGYDPVYGARPLKRLIQRTIQKPLALAILEGRFAPGDTVRVDRAGEELSFSRLPPAEEAISEPAVAGAER